MQTKGNCTQPFLKWAGGKRWLVENHRDLFDIPFERLVEPFLGSGAVFFGLVPETALLHGNRIKIIGQIG